MPRPQMITDDYDDDRQSNLPPTVSGSLPQAVVRKNARRGGTPNAPEVDDEAAPATNNGSALPQAPAQPTPPTIATLPRGATGTWDDNAQPPPQPGGVPLSGPFPTYPTIGQIGQAVGQTFQTSTPLAQRYAPTPAIEPKAGPGETAGTPDIATLPPVEARPSSVPDSAPVQPAVKPAPPGYIGVGGVGAPGGAIAAPTMTTEQANQFYGAQNEAMKAKEAQDLDENRARSMETTNKGVAAYQADQIRHGTELFHARNVLAQGGLVGAGGALATARDLTGEAAGLEKFARAPSAIPQRNLIGEQAGQAAAVQAQQHNALMNPLHVEQLKQGIAAGGTAQRIAELTLKGHEREQGLLDKIDKAETPEEAERLMSQWQGTHGQTKVAIVDQDTGQRDAMGSPVFKKVAVNTSTGKFLEPQGTMGTTTGPPVEGAQFKGRKGTPDEGKFYKVIGGQHVETDAAGNPLKK